MSRTFDTAQSLLRQMTGKYYPLVEKVMRGMTENELHEFLRMLRDLEAEKVAAVNNIKRQPWRS